MEQISAERFIAIHSVYVEAFTAPRHRFECPVFALGPRFHLLDRALEGIYTNRLTQRLRADGIESCEVGEGSVSIEGLEHGSLKVSTRIVAYFLAVS